MNLISVIVPIYNSEKFLSECINSILKQTYQEFEVILVDDGSIDSSKEICQKYSQYDKRVKYIRKENEGVSSARNKGIELAQGEYIIFIDSDDFIKENMFEKLIEKNNFDFTMCGYELYNNKKSEIIKQYCCLELCSDLNKLANNIENYLFPPFLLGPCFKLFKKSIIDKFKIKFPIDLSYGEDAIFVFEYLIHCNKINIVSYIGYSYRKHSDDTLSSKFLIDKIDINYRINFLIKELLKKEKVNNYSEILSNKLFDNFVSYTQELICSEFNFKKKKKIYYEKFNKYKNQFGLPNRISKKLITCIGNYHFFYFLIYIFKLKNILCSKI